MRHRRRLLCWVALLAAAAAGGPAGAEPEPEEPQPSLPNISAVLASRALRGSQARLAQVLDGSTETPILYQELARAAGQAWVQVVCATGLDGHATAVLLLSNPSATVYRFVAGNATRPQVREALRKEFGQRFVEVEGPTKVTVRDLAHQRPRVRCDLLLVGDGGDAAGLAADLATLRAVANPLRNEVFAVDAGREARALTCLGCEVAWATAVKAGLLIPGTPIPTDGGARLLIGEFEPDAAAPARVALSRLGDGGARELHQQGRRTASSGSKPQQQAKAKAKRRRFRRHPHAPTAPLPPVGYVLGLEGRREG